MNNQQQTDLDIIISRAQFRKLTSLSRTSEWKLQKLGNLPPVVKINGRILGYRASAYSAWLKQHSA